MLKEDVFEAGSGDSNGPDFRAEPFHQADHPFRSLGVREADLAAVEPGVSHGEFISENRRNLGRLVRNERHNFPAYLGL